MRDQRARENLTDAQWSRLCRRLEALKANPGYLETDAAGVRNEIVAVDEVVGTITLRSARARSAQPRVIRRRDVAGAERGTAHGVIRRVLFEMARDARLAGIPTSTRTWIGPFTVERLLRGCMDKDQPWPEDHAMVYVVTRRLWDGAPSPASEPLYVGGTHGRSPRFVTRVGDLIADMLGFYGAATGHHSAGQRLYQWCEAKRVHPFQLHLGWLVDPAGCRRCEERAVWFALRPVLNVAAPAACADHRVAGWAGVWGIAGRATPDEVACLVGASNDEASIERATRRLAIRNRR